MKRAYRYLKQNRWQAASLCAVMLVIACVLLYRLGTLIPGSSAIEHVTATAPVGWHGIYHNPLYLPLKLVRSVVFFLAADHGRFLTRLPNVLFGGLAMMSFIAIVRIWHGSRTALLSGSLFVTSAWVLHVSRLASFDVLYLWAGLALILTQVILQRYHNRALVLFGSVFIWGLILYIPGLIWALLVSLYLQRKAIRRSWQQLSNIWQRILLVLLSLAWLPLLVVGLTRAGQLKLWLGLPTHFLSPLTIIKHFIGVFVHLFVRGPEYPQTWLGKAPILDVFAAVTCLAGLYFYGKNLKAARSRLLLSYFAVGVVLVTLGGPVGLSFLVPILYLVAATGITYLLHDWLKTFPLNPLARGLGIALISTAVALSCLYNLRAYFVAWPHNDVSRAAFHYKP